MWMDPPPPPQVQTEHLTVSLVRAEAAFVAGGRHWIGLRLQHAPGWHTYWINPGDSGLPTRTRWTLPAGVSVAPLAWPVPARHLAGGLYNFGYDGVQVLPLELRIDPALADVTAPLQIAVNVDWLVCEENCIPGKATLGMEIPLAAQPGAATEHAQSILAAVAAVPQAQDWPVRLDLHPAHIDVEISGLPTDLDAVEVFPLTPQVFAHAPGMVTLEAGTLRWRSARSDAWSGLPEQVALVLRTATAHHQVTAVTPSSPSPTAGDTP